jgi:hypothetical protein
VREGVRQQWGPNNSTCACWPVSFTRQPLTWSVVSVLCHVCQDAHKKGGLRSLSVSQHALQLSLTAAPRSFGCFRPLLASTGF